MTILNTEYLKNMEGVMNMNTYKDVHLPSVTGQKLQFHPV